MDGVGALRPSSSQPLLTVRQVSASSTAAPHPIRYFNDERCKRTERFFPSFAVDGANGSRWMAAKGDSACWLLADLGRTARISQSELCFVRPTQGHAYVLEGSEDGIHWEPCGGHEDVRRQSPHTDVINRSFRFLRVRITAGIPGVWEWRILGMYTENNP